MSTTHTPNTIENVIQSKYPFATDATQREARRTFYVMKNANNLVSPDVVIAVTAHRHAMDRLSESHTENTRQLFEVAFQNEERRTVQTA
jgi:intracellular sulfur oxidation DsrE/DsrF family protein